MRYINLHPYSRVLYDHVPEGCYCLCLQYAIFTPDCFLWCHVAEEIMHFGDDTNSDLFSRCLTYQNVCVVCVCLSI